MKYLTKRRTTTQLLCIISLGIIKITNAKVKPLRIF